MSQLLSQPLSLDRSSGAPVRPWPKRPILASLALVGLASTGFVASDYVLSAILIPVLVLALAGLGQNILTGYAGLLSVGSAAFMSVGAFTAYNVSLRVPGAPLLASFVAGGIVAAAVGVAFGLPSLRIRGFYLIVSTLAAQFFVQWVFTKVSWFSNHNSSGVISAPPLLILGLLQEAYVSASPGPLTIKLGKSYSRFGLFWDNSFYGNVQVYDGLKLAPDYGISVEGNFKLSDDVSLGATLQYYLVDGRINVSLPARDIVSVPDARRRNAVVARVDPEFRLGHLGTLRVGVSAQGFQADLPSADPTVLRAGIDATLKLGNLSLWGEAIEQRGRHVTDFPLAGTPGDATTPASAGRASSENRYYLAGGEYSLGIVTARFNASYAHYRDTKTQERFFVPALGIRPVSQLLLLAEFVYWKRNQDGVESFVDRSLNVTAHGYF